jgi:hypothetical protein
MKKIVDLLGVKPQEGDVGVEIEVEGVDLPVDIRGWAAVHDGSLRGESLEYVLKRPVPIKDLPEPLDRISKAYKACGSKVRDSFRAGVHVHVNVQQLTHNQVFNFICLYLIMEELLVDWCGDSRVGNHFCLRGQDAEWLITKLEAAATAGTIVGFFTDDVRYSSINPVALGKYGSLEFRAMRSTRDMNLIVEWAELLVELRSAAQRYDNPKQIVEALSAHTPERFLLDNLGVHANLFLDSPDLHGIIYRGVRLIQNVAFFGVWETKKKKMSDLYPLKEEDKPLVDYIQAHEVKWDQLKNVKIPKPPRAMGLKDIEPRF